MRPSVADHEIGEQSLDELFWLLDQLYEARCRSVLEIGSRNGNTLRMFATTCGPGAKIRSIDISDEAGLTKMVARLNVDGYDADCLIADSSSSAAIEWATRHGPFDFIFIDGDHEEGVARDWHNYRGLGRLIGFHDINHESHQTTPLWKAIKASGEYRTREFIMEGSMRGIGLVEVA